MINTIVELNQQEILAISGGNLTNQQKWRIAQATLIAVWVLWKTLT